MSKIEILPGDPREPAVMALLHQSHALMQSLFEPEENHFLEVEELCVPSIRFFVAREGDAPLGCVALANKGDYGEIKSMFVDPAARGKGIAHLLMQTIEAEAREQGLGKLKLETGDKLVEAHRLYKAHGFADCGPFGAYEANETSLFMTKVLG